MKLLTLALLVAVLSSVSTMFVQGDPNIPSFDQVTQIGLFSYKGWTLDINPDGSGNLTYGSSFGDSARIPQQTFSFQNTYNLLAPHLSKTYNAGKSIAVTLRIKDTPPGTPTYALYLDDRRIVRQIMRRLRDKGSTAGSKSI